MKFPKILALTLGFTALSLTAKAEALSSQVNAPAANSCNSPQMQQLFNACIYRRANCWEYNPGGYCYGVPSQWGRCYGRRPPMLGC